MTTITSTDPVIKTCTHGSSNRNGFRLVSSGAIAGPKSVVPATCPAVPCLVLKSALCDKNVVIEAALLGLFQSLRMDERIEFAHSFDRDEFGNAPAVHPYRLRIRVAAAPSRVEDLKTRVDTVFASS